MLDHATAIEHATTQLEFSGNIYSVGNALMARRTCPVFDFDAAPSAYQSSPRREGMTLNDSGAVKPLHVSGKGAPSKPVNARTVLENMIFSGKTPTTVGKEVRSQSAPQDSEIPTDSSS